ncbi:MAG TPA: endo alpha-1,4 polygalactosaminidase [Galbitalea sp.]|jgi:hypothetical protein
MRVSGRRQSRVGAVSAATAGVTVVAVVALLVGCAAGQATPGEGASSPVLSSRGIQPLPTGAKVDYQLGGGYSAPSGVSVVTRDSTDQPAAGLYNICYVNGFQTQGEDRAFWLDEHPTLILRSPRGTAPGTPITDPGWPDEMILDTSTPAKRASIATTLSTTLRACANKGFDAVEFDNLDSYTRSHGRLGLRDNVAEARLLVSAAHRLGLAAGQKNTPQLGRTGPVVIHFDFAVAEECYRYDECAGYTKFYGAKVIDIEYTGALRGSFAATCAAKQTPPMTILRDRDLLTPDSSKYVYGSC